MRGGLKRRESRVKARNQVRANACYAICFMHLLHFLYVYVVVISISGHILCDLMLCDLRGLGFIRRAGCAAGTGGKQPPPNEQALVSL